MYFLLHGISVSAHVDLTFLSPKMGHKEKMVRNTVLKDSSVNKYVKPRIK